MGAGSRMHAVADLRAAPEQVDHAESIAGVTTASFGREEGELGTHTFVTFGRRNASLRQPHHRDRLAESVRLVPFSPNTDLPFSPFRGGTAGLLAACACNTIGRVSSRRFQRTNGVPMAVTTARGVPANVHSYGSPCRTWV